MPTMATQYSEIFYRQRWSANRGQPRLILGNNAHLEITGNVTTAYSQIFKLSEDPLYCCFALDTVMFSIECVYLPKRK